MQGDGPRPPVLTDQPTAYAGCCLSLSRDLVDHFQTLLPPAPRLILSVGSGFGLLEAYLAAPTRNLHIIGVEVEPSSNRYLDAACHRIVHGTRSLEPLAMEATTWLFVYPRRRGLVQEYLAEYGHGSVDQIVWAGPEVDWLEYANCFPGWDIAIQSADAVGGRAWDLVAVATKTTG